VNTKRWAAAIAVVVAVALSGCRFAEYHPVAESDLVGTWQHEFDDGPAAVVTLNADGSAVLTDMPAVVFLQPGEVPSESEIDWSDRVTSDAEWTYTQRPLGDSFPSFQVRLADDGPWISPLIDNLSQPIRVDFWYGNDDGSIYFERVE
jgi:hypothetical protein